MVKLIGSILITLVYGGVYFFLFATTIMLGGSCGGKSNVGICNALEIFVWILFAWLVTSLIFGVFCSQHFSDLYEKKAEQYVILKLLRPHWAIPIFFLLLIGWFVFTGFFL